MSVILGTELENPGDPQTKWAIAEDGATTRW